MSDPRRKVSPGDRLDISARAWNDVMAMVREWRMMKPQGTGLLPIDDTPTVVRVWQQLGGANPICPRGGVMALTGHPTATPTANSGVLSDVFVKGVDLSSEPTGGIDYAPVIGIALEPIQVAQIGRCVVAGLVWAKVNIATSGDKYILPTTTYQYLVSKTHPTGYGEIIYPTTGTGTVWALVYLQNKRGFNYCGSSFNIHTLLVDTTGGLTIPASAQNNTVQLGLPFATPSNAGTVSTAAQGFSGAKTFHGKVICSNESEQLALSYDYSNPPISFTENTNLTFTIFDDGAVGYRRLVTMMNNGRVAMEMFSDDTIPRHGIYASGDPLAGPHFGIVHGATYIPGQTLNVGRLEFTGGLLTSNGGATSGTNVLSGYEWIEKTGAYQVLGTDRGKVIDCTSGTFTVSLTAAATLGNKFTVGVLNSGTGVITVDPNGSETIRDAHGAATTKTLAQGEGILLVCDGSNFKTIAEVKPQGYGRVAKTGAYTVVADDRGKIIDCTANTFTVSLTAAATLGAGFSFGVYNSGSGTITIDADGSETIRDPSGSATTKTLAQGEGVILMCDGSGWLVVSWAKPSSSSNAFGTVAVSGQSDVVADASADTLTLAAGSGITITTNAGTDTVTIASSGTSGFGRSAKTANYTVISSDANTIIDCTSGTFTVSLTAAATLGAGFMFGVSNSGTGVITIDPNGTEIVRRADDQAATTLVLSQGQSVLLQTDGSNWYQISANGLPLSPAGGSILMADHGTSLISPRGYWTELPIGTVGSGNKDGQILTCTKVDGSSVAYPTWGLAGFRRVAKTSAYTVVAADADYCIDCTSGTFTVSLTAAATIGDGFSCAIMNSGSGTITVDPNGAETIRDPSAANSTISLAQGESIIIQCDGSNWKVIAHARAGGGSTLPVADTTEIVKGSGDATKKLRIEADGITTGTTRVWTAQDSNLTVAGIDIAQTFTAAQTIQQGTLGNAVFTLLSTATNDDPTTIHYQNRVATTNATTTTLHTLALADNTMYRITAKVWGRRTGGSGGSAGDSCYYVIEGAYKRTSAGAATAVGMGAGYTIVTSFADNMAFGFGADLATSGNNVLVRVTGDTNNNYSWHCHLEVSALSS